MKSPFKTKERVVDRLNIRDGLVYKETVEEMVALPELLRSVEGTVLKYVAVLIRSSSNWVVPFKKMTTATTVTSRNQKLPHQSHAQGTNEMPQLFTCGPEQTKR